MNDSHNGNGRPRRVSSGDVSPSSTELGIQQFTVSESTQAAQEAKIAAVKDVINEVPPHDVVTLAKVLAAIMEGTAPDDSEVVRNTLLNRLPPSPKTPPNSDDILSAGWRKGDYPYKHLMTRKTYEKKRYRLQVELLKLQSWVKEIQEPGGASAQAMETVTRRQIIPG